MESLIPNSLSLDLPSKLDLPLSEVFTCLSSTVTAFTITTFDGIFIALRCINPIFNLFVFGCL